MYKDKSGAIRESKKPNYNLIPLEGLEELARRYSLGKDKYGPDQWKQGGPEFFEDCLNHAAEHLWKAMNNIPGEDDEIQNLAACAWGCMARIWYLKQNEALSTKE